MNHLSLFTGAGGGELGALLLGWRTIGYVENNDYCQRVIAQRIKDGILHEAPIFSDIRAFNSEGYAERYRGLVDVISAGFPCQPFSVAGQQRGADDDRNMWPATIDTIWITEPRFVLLENVPGIQSYMPVVIRDLRRFGYNSVQSAIIPAAWVGAPHIRKRIWIVAYTKSQPGLQANPEGDPYRIKGDAWPEFGDCNREDVSGEDWILHESHFLREIDGVASRVDRLRALGNGQVPAVVRAAWEILT